jgi:hypothetical protein
VRGKFRKRKKKVSRQGSAAAAAAANKARGEERRGEGSEISQKSANFLQSQLQFVKTS